MTTRREQIESEIARARALHGGSDRVMWAADQVEAMLTDGGEVPGPWGPSSCFDWSAPDAGTLQRLNYRAICREWEAKLGQRIRMLAAELLAVGDVDGAETLGAEVDRSVNVATESGSLIPAGPDWFWTWWNTAPLWQRAIVVAGGAWLAVDLVGKVKAAIR